MFTLPILALALPVAASLLAQGPGEPGVAPNPEPAPAPSGLPAQLQWGDYDADGLDDALAITPEGGLTLLHNSGDGSFEDATLAAGLDGIANARFAVWQDYDKDGLADLFVGTARGASHLLHNAGALFMDVTATSGLTATGTDLSAHWIDYDGDGLLDLHLVNASENTMYHALVAGGFEPVALPSTARPTGVITSASAGSAANRETLPTRAAESVDEPAKGRDTGGRIAMGGPGGAMVSSQTLVSDRGGFVGPSTQAAGACADSIRDQGNSGCMQASSQATLGMLYPLSSRFFVDEATGRVGIGTTNPLERLDVAGDVRVNGSLVISGDQWVGTPAQWGTGNSTAASDSTVGGGSNNTASGVNSTVGGGKQNTATMSHSTVGGGNINGATGHASTVGGGRMNTASGTDSTVGGGTSNTATDLRATVCGGQSNDASGIESMVCGGFDNTASGRVSFAAGFKAQATHDGAFVWGDRLNVSGKTSSIDNEFNVYADGGVRMFAVGQTDPSMVIDTNGRVGIGTATPGALSQLHVVSPSESYGLFHEDGTVGVGTYIADGSACPQGAHVGTTTNHPLSFITNSTCGKMVLDVNGNLGIGTNAPLTPLHIQADSSWPVRIAGNTSPGINIENTAQASSFAIYHDSNDNLQFRDSTSGVPRMVISGSNGNVGIGTTTPTWGLEVASTFKVQGLHVLLNDDVGIGTAAPTEKLHVVGNICATGTIGTCSDERYKETVEPLEDALDTVRKLRGVSYHWRTDEFPEHEFTRERQIGFLAQELLEEVPEAVSQGSDGYYSVDYGKLTPVLVEAVKEQDRRVEELAEENAELRARVKRLESMEAELASLKASLALLVETR
jgi:hypothetical protein